jgi:hypothetical protein
LGRETEKQMFRECTWEGGTERQNSRLGGTVY